MEQIENQTPEKEQELEAGRMPFMAHLVELRKRLIYSVLAVAVGFGICFPFKEKLLAFIIDPLKAVLPEGTKLVYIALPEAFFTYLKISILAGILLAMPVIFYQIWRFVGPGLYQHEKKYAAFFVLASSFLFLGGAVFGYGVVFPFGFQFFASLQTQDIELLPRLKDYFSLTVRLLIAFGATFELPVVIFILARMGLVTDKTLRKNRKWAFLMAFVVGAILTPADWISQVAMAIPLIVLFEISIWVAKFFGKKKKPETDEEAPAERPAEKDEKGKKE